MIRTENDRILKKFSTQTVMYPTFARAHKQLQNSIRATELRGEPSCALLSGPSGSGKSKMCRMFRNSIGSESSVITAEGKARRHPAFLCTVPAPVTVKSFSKAILTRLGHPRPTGDSEDMKYELIQAIQTAGIRVMIFDEFQRLVKPEAHKARKLLIDWLVALLGEIKIPVIICGTPECRELLSDDPLARRYPYLAKLDFLSFATREESEFTQTLLGLDEAMHRLGKFEGGVHCQDMSLAIPLFAATIGNLEYLRQTLYEAMNSCLERSDRVLRREDFVEACYVLSLPKNLMGLANPFECSQSECLKKIKAYETTKAEQDAEEEAAFRAVSP